MSTRAADIARNLDQVRARIEQATRAAGRSPGSVRLVAVSKTMPAQDVAAALAAGQRDFGENYAQELRDKRPALEGGSASSGGGGGAGPGPRWHFIGPLQSNKVKYLAGKVALLHTVDSPGLLGEIGRRLASEPRGEPQECLVQVNVAGEGQKRGVAPGELPALLEAFAAHQRLRCVGLMLIPPLGEDPEASRPHFQALRRLQESEGRQARAHVELRELSMGMSHDLHVAVAEGATIVRVGTAIFGARRSAPP